MNPLHQLNTLSWDDLPVGDWRQWAQEPPQIPFAPIAIWRRWQERGVAVTRAELGQMVDEKSQLFWKPLGIYREEFWSVTGRWV